MINTIELTNVRSYKSNVFQFGNSVNIIVGPNASGKTNLLESVHLISTGKGFKNTDEDMVSRDSEWARVDAMFDNENRTIKIKKQPKQKIFDFGGVIKSRMPKNKIIPVVLFEPSHLLMLSGEPEKRRAFLDELISQNDSQYEQTLKRYRRTLAQRNRLLREGNLNESQVFIWDIKLSELGGKIFERRFHYIKKLNEILTENYQQVSGSQEKLEIRYVTKIITDNYANNMLSKLKHENYLDLKRGFTGTGPHRDDFDVYINGNNTKKDASRGETRSVVLALKLCEINIAEKNQEQNEKPILLFDDVFSELDGKRRRSLSQTLQRFQTFITTTDADVAIEYFRKSCNIIPTSQEQ